MSQPVTARPSSTARKATGIRNPADGSDIATKGIAASNENDNQDDPAATQGVGHFALIDPKSMAKMSAQHLFLA
jgi:hypothetical protein